MIVFFLITFIHRIRTLQNYKIIIIGGGGAHNRMGPISQKQKNADTRKKIRDEFHFQTKAMHETQRNVKLMNCL